MTTNKEIITVFPFDEGVAARQQGKSKHDNPYKEPNTARTCFVKSEAWLQGFNDKDNHYIISHIV